MTKVPSREELSSLRKFVEENKADLPAEVVDVLFRLFSVYEGFLQSVGRAKNMLNRLREAMGLNPKSERGTQITGEQTSFAPGDLTPLQQEQLKELEEKQARAKRESVAYAKRIRALRPKTKSQQLEFALECEMMFSEPPGVRKNVEKDEKVERMAEFGRESGMQSAHEFVKRVDLQILVTETRHRVETVTDPQTGVSVRAPMIDVGPEGFQLTWNAIANLVKLHVGFAIPVNRLAALIGQPEFRSGKICRILQYVATNLLLIYLCLIENVADAEILSGDDWTAGAKLESKSLKI